MKRRVIKITLQIPVKLMDKIIEDKLEDLEIHLDTLLHQKDILQRIEKYTDKLDFGDLIETYKLLVEEIERIQQELRRLKTVSSLPASGEKRECVEEELSSSSFSYK